MEYDLVRLYVDLFLVIYILVDKMLSFIKSVFNENVSVFFDHFDIAFKLLHLGLHALLAVLFRRRVGHHTQALIPVMKLLPVLLQAVNNFCSFFIAQ